ncbi:hypothetical protein NC652_022247 [Populus alba x Populus x berolinensis]|nr:hypothetical protein NC652_022247 [Populus alba x Populus x berolinensis]
MSTTAGLGGQMHNMKLPTAHVPRLSSSIGQPLLPSNALAAELTKPLVFLLESASEVPRSHIPRGHFRKRSDAENKGTWRIHAKLQMSLADFANSTDPIDWEFQNQQQGGIGLAENEFDFDGYSPG